MEVKHDMSKLTMDDFGEILGSYMAEPGWSKLCLLLDYDGTLAPHGSHPDLTVRDERGDLVNDQIRPKRCDKNFCLI